VHCLLKGRGTIFPSHTLSGEVHLTLARQIGHRELISIFLLNLGTLAYEQQNYAQAETYLLEELALVRQLDHREWITVYLINIDEMMQKQGNYARAEVHLREGLERAKVLGSLRIIADALHEYGNLHLNRHQIAEAAAIFNDMLNSIPDGDQEMLALAHYGQARVAAAQHNIPEARRIGAACATALEAIGHHKALEVRQWLASLPDG
jgi:tetratricopeptide (TPR) repeat protein